MQGSLKPWPNCVGLLRYYRQSRASPSLPRIWATCGPFVLFRTEKIPNYLFENLPNDTRLGGDARDCKALAALLTPAAHSAGRMSCQRLGSFMLVVLQFRIVCWAGSCRVLDVVDRSARGSGRYTAAPRRGVLPLPPGAAADIRPRLAGAIKKQKQNKNQTQKINKFAPELVWPKWAKQIQR